VDWHNPVFALSGSLSLHKLFTSCIRRCLVSRVQMQTWTSLVAAKSWCCSSQRTYSHRRGALNMLASHRCYGAFGNNGADEQTTFLSIAGSRLRHIFEVMTLPGDRNVNILRAFYSKSIRTSKPVPWTWRLKTAARGSAVAEGPRDARCQWKIYPPSRL